MEKQSLILNNDRYDMNSIVPLFDEKEEKGVAKITRYHFSEKKDMLYNMRSVRGGGTMFTIKTGDYCRLQVNGELMMSDTGMERISNRDFVDKANGRVFVAGLGLGLIIHNIIDKEEVTEIVVIEKHQDVIDLVKPKFNSPKLKIICADALEYVPPKGEKFDTIYFDIWATICEDHLEEIKMLHNRYKFRLNRDNPKCWMNSWMKEYLQAEKRRNANSWW